jgi:hypothetical protein
LVIQQRGLFGCWVQAVFEGLSHVPSVQEKEKQLQGIRAPTFKQMQPQTVRAKAGLPQGRVYLPS